MRNRTIGQIVSDIRDIILRPHCRLPTLTCSVCGKSFYYRGIEDADCIAGSTYDATTGTFIASGGTPAVCTECQRKGYRQGGGNGQS